MISVQLPASAVELWWPNGKGAQPLYPVEITWTDGSSLPISISKNVAFRQVKLVQKTYSDPNNVGRSFYFEINGIPTFVKGSNWIPAEMFESRVDKKRIESLLQNAVEANMNVIRNWGGGIYQSDEFYDFCDKNGLMVWEEFMFACAMYPRDSPFLETVKEEVKYQVSRLAHHPSIFIWASNNENEGALTWYPESRANRDLFVVDQEELYVNTIRSTILQGDTSRPFLFSSPTNGVISEDPYVLMWGPVWDTRYGDVHYYNYDFLCTNESEFPNARFVSEYGWQSFPSYYSWKDVANPSDLSFDSPLMEHRQHHPDGNQQILAQMKRHFQLPTGKSDPIATFQDYVYLSQTVQAMCIRAQTEHYRRNKDLSYNTMGALYWQFNDVWQAPTWSSLEYDGRWKMLHYFVQNFFQEVLVSSFVDTTTYTVKVINDLPNQVKGTLSVILYSYANSSVVKKISTSVSVPALGAYSIPYQVSSLMCSSEPCYNLNEVFVLLSFQDDSGKFNSENYFHFAPLSEVSLPKPKFSITNANNNNNIIQFTVTTDEAAPFIWLESPYPGHYSANGFWLAGQTSKTVTFTNDEGVSVVDFLKSLTVNTIAHTIAK